MNILARFQKVLENNLRESLGNYLHNTITAFTNPYNIDSYKQFIEEFDVFTANLSKDTYEEFILALDEEFMQSKVRKQTYDSRGYLTKPLLTKFGLINFKRRKYESKTDGKSFMFVDRLLGLERYKRLDPFVIGDLIEESSTNSYAKAGRNVSKTIGSKIKYDDDINKSLLSRATVRNNVIKASMIMKEPNNGEVKAVKLLNMMLDEKFVGSQFNDNKDHMIKSAVVYEGIAKEYKNRIKLTGKKVFGNIEGNLLSEVMDYIYYNYDTDKLETINIMGDGAKWIESFATDSSFKYHSDLKINRGLDHFHMAQAIKQIATNKNEIHYKFMYRYVRQNKYEYFLKVCACLIKKYPHREHTIKEKMLYIVNNWQTIQNSFKTIKYKCSMESNISHVFADIFTSRPKAYSTNGLKLLLNIRLLKINGHDLKKLYFESLKETKKNTTEREITKRVINTNKNAKYTDALYHSLIDSNFSLNINNENLIKI